MIKRDLSPAFVSEVIPFPFATCERLQETRDAEFEALRCTIGRISKDGLWSYLANGSCLEVTSMMTGERISAWKAVNSNGTKNCQFPIITCVEELFSRNSSGPKLVIGIDNGTLGGLLCLFNVKTSEILKTIEIPRKVTAIEIISHEGGAVSLNKILAAEFRCMFGVVAVGTVEGHVYVVDLCLDVNDINEFNKPANLFFVTPHMKSIYLRREDAISREQHLCVVLGESAVDQNDFNFIEPDGFIRFRMKKDNVFVTCIKYFPGMCTMAVGYNFSGFQLWNLHQLTIEHSQDDGTDSRVGSGSVTEFACQEPENDPRLFCYLWVARSGFAIDSCRSVSASICMYALAYSSKHYEASVGHYYETLQSCSLRFDHSLTSDSLGVAHVETNGSRVIRCNTLENYLNNTANVNRNNDDGIEQCTLNLLVVVWEAWYRETTYSKTFIALFDLNQWYKSQMPASIRVNSGLELCPFFGVFSLQEVTEKVLPDFLIDVQVVRNSVSPFQKMSTNELYFYPSALAFRVACVSDVGIINASYLGLQRQILYDLKRSGCETLIDPQKAFNMCVYGGLLKSAEISLSKSSQREALLSLALENNMLDFISSCVAQWGNRELSGTGCSSRLILEWAWKKMSRIKSGLDKLCLPLFNYSGVELDALQVTQFHQYCVLLQHLVTILRFLVNHAKPLTNQGLCELEARINVVTLIHTQYSVIKWCHGIGLLPEQEENDNPSSKHFVIPVQNLEVYYKQRRLELQKINSLIRGNDLLLIDGIMSRIGEPLSNTWEKDNGFSYFPPPNLYSILKIYLVDGISLMTKHQIVLYLFLDLIACLSDEKHGELKAELMNFSSAFSIPPTTTKITYAFWLLDHADFSGAINMLLNPLVSVRDIESWQCTLVMKAFLYQGEHEKALKFLKIQRPTISTPEDMKLCLTIHLTNGLIVQAHQFLRECHDLAIAEDLLQHFFLGCQQTKSLQALFQLPLNKVEREQLSKFLNSSREQYSKEMLIMFCLQRNQFLQAFALNDQLKTKELSDARSLVRNSIVDGYAKVLPKTHQMLYSSPDLYCTSKSFDSNNEIFKPQPLSTAIRASDTHVISQTSLIKTVLDKIEETNANSTDDTNYSPLKTNYKFPVGMSDNLPFLGPPVSSTHDANSELSEVIYPLPMTTGENDNSTYLTDFSVSPSKRSRLSDNNSFRRRKSKEMVAELMSTLQTSPLRRKTPSSTCSTPMEICTEMTPQSILKVRHLVQGSTSPPQLVEKTSFTFNSPAPSSVPHLLDETVPESSKNTESLAKQLRFALPGSSNESPEEKIKIPDSLHEASFPAPRRPLHISESSPAVVTFTPPLDKSKENVEEFYFSPPLGAVSVEREIVINKQEESKEITEVRADDNSHRLHLEFSDSASVSVSVSDSELLNTSRDDEDDDDDEKSTPTKKNATLLSINSSGVSWHTASPSETSDSSRSHPSTPTSRTDVSLTQLQEMRESSSPILYSDSDLLLACTSASKTQIEAELQEERHNLEILEEEEIIESENLEDEMIESVNLEEEMLESENLEEEMLESENLEEKDMSEKTSFSSLERLSSVDKDDTFVSMFDDSQQEEELKMEEGSEDEEDKLSIESSPELKTPPKMVSPVRTSLRLSTKKSPQSTVTKQQMKGKALSFTDESKGTSKGKKISTPAKKKSSKSQLTPITQGKKYTGRKSIVKSEAAETTTTQTKRNYRSRLRSSSPDQTTESAVSVTYSFSQPVTLNQTPSDDLPEPKEDKTFIFSPPLTRARSKMSKKSSGKREKSSDDKEKEKEINKSTKEKAVKKTKVRKRRSPELFVSNSPINFISPVTVSDSAQTPRRSKRIMKAKEAPRLKKINPE